MNNLFKDIGEMPATEPSSTSAAALADYTDKASSSKGSAVLAELAKNEAAVHDELSLASQRVQALNEDGTGESFDLQDIINGWFSDKIGFAKTEVQQRSAMKLTIDSAATFGTISDALVRMFVDSAETKATGKAKFEVAKVLDEATDVAGNISQDSDVQAAKIEAKATELIENWSKNRAILDILFKRLFDKVLNRVLSYQTRLGNIGGDLASKSVLLDRVAASLRARQQMVKDNLLETCINGLALEAMINDAKTELDMMEAQLAKTTGSARGPLNEQVKEQQGFVQIMIKRLVDLKGFAVKEIAYFSVIGTIRNSVAVIRADVEFTRTNLIAALGLMLGLVADIVSSLRVAKATKDVRLAEAKASEAVGTATEALQNAANEALLDVQTTMHSLEITIQAATRGIKNTRENMEKVEAMQLETNLRLSQMLADMGNA